MPADPPELPSPIAGLTAAITGLPADSIAVAALPEPGRYGARFAATEFGRRLRSPEVAALVAASLTVEVVSLDLARLRTALATVAQFDGRDLVSVGAALFPLPDGTLGAGVRIRCVDPEAIAGALDARLRSQRGSESTATVGDRPYRCHGRICRMVHDDTLWVATPAAALHRLATAAGETPLDPPALDRAATGIGHSVGALFAWADLAAVVRDTSAPLGELGAGLDQLTYSETVVDDRFRAALTIIGTGPVVDLLARRPADGGFDQVLPASADRARFGRVGDPAAAGDLLLDLVRRLLGQRELTRLDDAELLIGQAIGIDVRGEILAALDGDLGIATWPGDAAAEPGWLVVAGLRDRATIEASLRRAASFASSMGLRNQMESVGGATLWRVELGSAVGAAGVIRDRLVLSNRELEARAVLDGSPQALASDPEYQRLAATVVERPTWSSFVRSPGLQLQTLVDDTRELQRHARAAESQAFEELSALGAALEAYRAAHQSTPVDVDPTELASLLVPRYAPRIETVDPWGQSYGYAHQDAGYAVWSAGADRQLERDWAPCAGGCQELTTMASDDRDDIVVANGQFVRWPDLEEIPPAAALTALATRLDRELAGLAPTLRTIERTDGGLRIEESSSLPTLLGLVDSATVLAALELELSERSPTP